MKNILKMMGIIALALVIGFGMTACGGDDDDSSSSGGGLTITGLGDFNGLYAFADSEDYAPPELMAASKLSGSTITLGKISGGSVTLNVFDDKGKKYTGSDKSVKFDITILDTDKLSEPKSQEDMLAMMMNMKGAAVVTINFTDGAGSGAATDISEK